MNKNITKISFAVFSVLTLILCQFWTCSTAQTINHIVVSDNVHINKQEEQASKDKGSSILFFKLLTPIVPKDGPQVSKTNLSDGHSVDIYTSLIRYNNTLYITSVEFPPFVGNRCYYNNEHSIYSLEYAFELQSRGPPSLMC